MLGRIDCTLGALAISRSCLGVTSSTKALIRPMALARSSRPSFARSARRALVDRFVTIGPAGPRIARGRFCGSTITEIRLLPIDFANARRRFPLIVLGSSMTSIDGLAISAT